MGDRGKLRAGGFDEFRSLDLEAFPVANDFAVELINDDTGSSIQFLAPGIGVIVRFPWWDNVRTEIAGWSLLDTPNGSIESPYWDMDQGWHILIWQSDDLVYIAQGGSQEDEYDIWFSLPAVLYRAAWGEAIQLAASAGNAR